MASRAETKEIQAAIQKLTESVTDCSERMRAMAVFSADSKSAIAAQLMSHRAEMVRLVGQHQEKQRVAIEEITTYVHRHFEDIRRRFERLDEVVGRGAVNERAARLQEELGLVRQRLPALLPHQVLALEHDHDDDQTHDDDDDEDDDEYIGFTWESAIEQARQRLIADEMQTLHGPEAQQP